MLKVPITTYDTIKLFFRFNNIEQYFNCFNFLESKLEKAKSIQKRENIFPVLSGYLMGMQIIVTPRGLIARGSLCKCAIGNNYYSVSIEKIQEAFTDLSKELQIPLLKAQVLRIDIGLCILMQYPTEYYFKSLGTCKGYERWERAHSLYYENCNRTIIFYNKRKEVESKRDYKLLEEMGQNVLRCELRFKKDLPRQFNKQNITGEDLFNPTFYNSLTNRFKAEYYKIHKIKLLSPIKNNLSCNDGIDYTLSSLIELQGTNNLNKIIERLKYKFTRGAFARYQKKLKSLKFLSKESELITELNTKILQITENALLIASDEE